MAWLSMILFAVTVSSALSSSERTARHKLFTNIETMHKFATKFIEYLLEHGIFVDDPDEKISELKEIVLEREQKKDSKLITIFCSKLAEILFELIDDQKDEIQVIDTGIEAISYGLKKSIRKTDKNIINSVREIIDILRKKNIEEEIEEIEEEAEEEEETETKEEDTTDIDQTQQNQIIINTDLTTSSTQDTTVIQSSETDTEEDKNNINDIESGSSTQVTTATAAATSSAAAVSQVTVSDTDTRGPRPRGPHRGGDYVEFRRQLIIYLRQYLSSITIVEVSYEVIIISVVTALQHVGVSQSTAEQYISQYLSELEVGEATTDQYLNAIATASSEAISVSDIEIAGREIDVSQTIAQQIQTYLNSQHRGRPSGRPSGPSRPAPQHPRQSTQVTSATAAAASSAAAVSQVTVSDTDTRGPRPRGPHQGGDSEIDNVQPVLQAAAEAESLTILTASANTRISSLSNSLSSVLTGGQLNFESFSSVLMQQATRIRKDSDLSETEIVIEVLLETVSALLVLVTGSTSDVVIFSEIVAKSFIDLNVNFS